MKIRPEIFLLNKKNDIFKKILICGSDTAFIDYLTSYVLKKYKEKGYFINLTGSINISSTGDLFSGKKTLYLLKDLKSKKDIVKISDTEDSLVISTKNSKAVNELKSEYSKLNDSLVLDCYPLNRDNKELVIKKHIDDSELHLDKDVFWYIVENFENNYVLLKKQLKTLSYLNDKNISIKDIESAVHFENKINIDKIFFYIFHKNDFLIRLFNKNIFSISEFYIFMSSLKFYINLISESKNTEEALSKFPRYLFNEKGVFVKIYKKLNSKKLIKIYNNISRAESVVRKTPKLYSVVGLRFLLNAKKIITS